MERHLSFDLHRLTARLDRAADRILRVEHGVAYRRFLVLARVGELGAATQRALAEVLGVTEPSVSRMVASLADARLLDVRPDPEGGNRRRISLTDEGKRLVAEARGGLEDRLALLVERSGIPYEEYAGHTARLLATFDRLEKEAGR